MVTTDDQTQNTTPVTDQAVDPMSAYQQTTPVSLYEQSTAPEIPSNDASFQSYPLPQESLPATVVVSGNDTTGIPIFLYILLTITIILFFIVGTLLFLSLTKPQQIQESTNIQPETVQQTESVPTGIPTEAVDQVITELEKISNDTDISSIESEIEATNLTVIGDQ